MTESLGVSLGRYTADRASVLVDWPGVVLELLAECVTCEDVDDAHEVDVLLVRAEKPAIKRLVEPHVVMIVHQLVTASLDLKRI